MRTVNEIKTEMTKVETVKRNAERKRARCIERTKELKAELRAAMAGGSNEIANS